MSGPDQRAIRAPASPAVAGPIGDLAVRHAELERFTRALYAWASPPAGVGGAPYSHRRQAAVNGTLKVLRAKRDSERRTAATLRRSGQPDEGGGIARARAEAAADAYADAVNVVLLGLHGARLPAGSGSGGAL